MRVRLVLVPGRAGRSDRHRRRGRRGSSLRDARLPVHDDQADDQEPSDATSTASRSASATPLGPHEPNPLGHDPAGVDVTLVLAVDPENEIVVGLDPLVYAELPMGVSGYYNDDNEAAVHEHGWATGPRRRPSPATDQGGGVGGHRVDGRASGPTASSTTPDSRRSPPTSASRPACGSGSPTSSPRARSSATTSRSCSASTPRPSWTSSRATSGSASPYAAASPSTTSAGSLAERPAVAAGSSRSTRTANPTSGDAHGRAAASPSSARTPCGRPTRRGRKVESQKTRDSGAGRKYTFDAFDVLAACMFPVTGRWTFQFKSSRDLAPWSRTRRGSVRSNAVRTRPGRTRSRVSDSWVGQPSEGSAGWSGRTIRTVGTSCRGQRGARDGLFGKRRKPSPDEASARESRDGGRRRRPEKEGRSG